MNPPQDPTPKAPQPEAETVVMGPLVPLAALPERYEILGELGRGGMGIVYQARDRETGEVLAIKILKPEIASDAQILERFKNELRLAHKITHRNVARLYEFHRSGETVYVSMEFVEGESLRALIRRTGKMDLETGLPIARQLAAGLGEAHRQSIVHRDLKPENIMLTPAGELKVMDFGISRSYAAGVTATGAIIGTPAYMAPEQAEGKPTDQRTDVYAMGLVLYEMFTGIAAFSGETPVSVALKQVRDRPDAPSKLAPGLPKHLERAILTCLEKDPAKRFQSVEDLMRALEGAPVQKKKARSPRWIWSAAATILVIAAAVGLWLWRGRTSESLRFPIEQFTLSNGLPVALSVDHSSPTFSLSIEYRAGIRAETPGHEGLPLVMAHLMQQGSSNVAPGEYASLVKGAGGEQASGVDRDDSNFALTLPANQLELALFLEADRMRSLEITQAGLDTARAFALQQLAQQRNRPYGMAELRLDQLASDNFADKAGLGTVEAMNALTVDDVTQFYRTYYTPSNAVLALVGDFDPKTARERVKHYFENIPNRPAPPKPDLHNAVHSGEMRDTVVDPRARVPLVAVGWRIPSSDDPDWFPLRSLGELLGSNDAARLHTSLVKAAGVASGVEVDMGNSVGPNLLLFVLVAAEGKDLSQLESLFNQEIERIKKDGVSEGELQRVRRSGLRTRALSLVSTRQRSALFALFMAKFGQADRANQWEEHEQQLSTEDLRRVAQKYFTPANRVVVAVMPGGGGAQ